mgnify:CR=1 FL=1
MGILKGLSFHFVHFISQFIMTQNAWNYSVQTTRQAFWKMVEKGEEADIFDLIFSELTIEQLKSINKLIDAKIWAELHLEEKN